jgi:hypothetical protein
MGAKGYAQCATAPRAGRIAGVVEPDFVLTGERAALGVLRREHLPNQRPVERQAGGVRPYARAAALAEEDPEVGASEVVVDVLQAAHADELAVLVYDSAVGEAVADLRIVEPAGHADGRHGGRLRQPGAGAAAPGPT